MGKSHELTGSRSQGQSQGHLTPSAHLRPSAAIVPAALLARPGAVLGHLLELPWVSQECTSSGVTWAYYIMGAAVRPLIVVASRTGTTATSKKASHLQLQEDTTI